jgi:hypothetical protein
VSWCDSKLTANNELIEVLGETPSTRRRAERRAALTVALQVALQVATPRRDAVGRPAQHWPPAR